MQILALNDDILTFQIGDDVATVKTGTEMVYQFDYFRPEHGRDVELPCVASRICTINGKPFELTIEQYNELNELYLEYLEDLE